VVHTTRQQSFSATERTKLQGGNFKSFFKRHRSARFSTHLAMPDTVKNSKCCICLNNRYLVLPTEVLEILEVGEVPTLCISAYLQNRSRLKELDFKPLKMCFQSKPPSISEKTFATKAAVFHLW